MKLHASHVLMISEYHGRFMSALAAFIIRCLNEIGTRALFGVPGGGGNLDLIEAAGDASLPFVLTATETGGALAAMAQAEITGHLGACLTTLGPGAASVVNGVACAFLDRAPLVVFTDRNPMSADGAFEHQQFDHEALFKPITKWSGCLTPDCAQRTLERAFHIALADPPGPVHIDCPGEIGTASLKSTSVSSRSTSVPGRAGTEVDLGRTVPLSTSAVSAMGSQFAALLAQARKPLVIIGLGARRSEDAIAIRALLERRELPAMVTYKAKGVVPDGHPCFAGVFTHALIERPLIDASDLIIGVGLDPVELLPRPWKYAQPIVCAGRWRVADRHVPFAAQHVTTTPTAVAEIESLLGRSEWDLDRVRTQVLAQRRAVDVPADGMSAQRVVATTAERLAPSARVTVDAGAHMLPATMIWPVTEPNQMLISNGLSTMGFALPAAIGAALLDREQPVVALTGDGGLLMCAAELLTAAREKLRIIVIVFADASLSLIEIKQQRRGLRPSGVALEAIRWPAIADGFGVTAFVAENEAELGRAIENALQVDGPTLIEAKIDRSNYARTLEIVRG
jgi:acetolactate synthase-1/2/3 large subunit